MTTITVSAYCALLIALPVILYQLYAFVLPAFSPTERRVAMPLLLMIPFLFIAGVVFGYFFVLGPALHFLLNFNDNQFNIQVRARDYYSFVTHDAARDGHHLPDPDGDPRGHTRLGIATPQQLRRSGVAMRTWDYGAGGPASERRPGQHADRDGAAHHPVRVEYRLGEPLRAAGWPCRPTASSAEGSGQAAGG